PRAATARTRVRGTRSAVAQRAHRNRTQRRRGETSPRTEDQLSKSLFSTSEENTVMGSVRVAIVGVGNCASSLVQGVEYYKDADPAIRVPGLMHVTFGPYHVRDLEFVAAFDVDAKKVGRDLAEAIGASENNTIKICDAPPTRSGPPSSPRRACRSSATTSSPRWAPPSPTACWPGCSRTGAWNCCAPTSSTSAATWTS